VNIRSARSGGVSCHCYHPSSWGQDRFLASCSELQPGPWSNGEKCLKDALRQPCERAASRCYCSHFAQRKEVGRSRARLSLSCQQTRSKGAQLPCSQDSKCQPTSHPHVTLHNTAHTATEAGYVLQRVF